ncbi:MAG: twitching motility protein PilT [Elusimicrobia bacterium RIFOXYB2_FULL_49_7]|nr:MAG: twitching motility protein PilT [Elusimicrobia bacterium RIFOXYB2_FULL_49_7]
MKSLLLDTTAYSHLLRGNTHVLDAIAEADTIYLSVIVLGELHAGFEGGSKKKENRELLKLFLRKPTVKTLLVTPETAEIFGSLKHTLRQSGTPIPLNDVWIASQAIETGAPIATFDVHFRTIPGVRLIDLT